MKRLRMYAENLSLAVVTPQNIKCNKLPLNTVFIGAAQLMSSSIIRSCHMVGPNPA